MSFPYEGNALPLSYTAMLLQSTDFPVSVRWCPVMNFKYFPFTFRMFTVLQSDHITFFADGRHPA